MTAIDRKTILGLLEECGLARSPFDVGLFLVNGSKVISPAYRLNIVRKRGRVRFGGAIGLYFRDFEALWRTSLSSRERKIDATLPLVMLIDNYAYLIDRGVFDYTDRVEELSVRAAAVCSLVRQLPQSIEEFDKCLLDKHILGKNISEYTHIFDYNDDFNLYYRKSVSFIGWFAETWPESAEHLRSCLTLRQLQRLGIPSTLKFRRRDT